MLRLFWNTEKSGKRFTLKEEILRELTLRSVLWCLKGIEKKPSTDFGFGLFWGESKGVKGRFNDSRLLNSQAVFEFQQIPILFNALVLLTEGERLVG